VFIDKLNVVMLSVVMSSVVAPISDEGEKFYNLGLSASFHNRPVTPQVPIT